MLSERSESKRRLAVAFAVSIALHEIAAGIVPRSLAEAPPRAEIVTRARILRVTLSPTPIPAPSRFFAAPLHTAMQPRAVARTEEGSGTPAARHRTTAPAVPEAPRLSNSRPVWELANGHAGSAALLAGNGTAAGTGNGSGAQGNGNDAVRGDEPCGFVTFSDPHGSQFDSRTGGFWVDVRMSVHFAGGLTQSMILDYPWYYSSEAANPWSDRNARDPNFPMRFQSPPAAKAAGEPPLVRYVMERSTPDGMTLLRDCPAPTPPA